VTFTCSGSSNARLQDDVDWKWAADRWELTAAELRELRALAQQGAPEHDDRAPAAGGGAAAEEARAVYSSSLGGADTDANQQVWVEGNRYKLFGCNNYDRSETTANCIIIDHFSAFESGLVAPFLYAA
jgi:hypothetical protein